LPTEQYTYLHAMRLSSFSLDTQHVLQYYDASRRDCHRRTAY
jgi:hypothetical protein